MRELNNEQIIIVNDILYIFKNNRLNLYTFSDWTNVGIRKMFIF